MGYPGRLPFLMKQNPDPRRYLKLVRSFQNLEYTSQTGSWKRLIQFWGQICKMQTPYALFLFQNYKWVESLCPVNFSESLLNPQDKPPLPEYLGIWCIWLFWYEIKKRWVLSSTSLRLPLLSLSSLPGHKIGIILHELLHVLWDFSRSKICVISENFRLCLESVTTSIYHYTCPKLAHEV